MTTLSDLRRALEAVPDGLLEPDDQRVLADALTSVDALEGLDIVPTAVAVVGCSGVGKSTLVNAALGATFAAVGVVRPTTRHVSMYGSSGPVAPVSVSEYVHVPDAPPGLVVIDTPPWEHDPDAVRAALAVADRVIVVVTPMRYADASVHGLMGEVGPEPTVVLNRVDTAHGDIDELRASVRERLGVSPVEVARGDDGTVEMASIVEGLPVDDDAYARASVLRAAAASTARHVARSAAAMAEPVAELVDAVASVGEPAIDGGHTVVDEWPPTRAELVRVVEEGRRSVDGEILASAPSSLAERVEASLPEWQPGSLAEELDSWREACRVRFTSDARIRWRRAHALALLDTASWQASINEDVTVPPRVRRIMGDRLSDARTDMRHRLDRIIADGIDGRRRAWADAAEALAAYAPGAVFGAAHDVAPPP